jgi:hypothetical protein
MAERGGGRRILVDWIDCFRVGFGEEIGEWGERKRRGRRGRWGRMRGNNMGWVVMSGLVR